MGLILEDDKHAILSDILGVEDHLGDMDFKVAGTEDGITAIQLDLKIDGISFDLMTEALAQAKEGRLHILNLMEQASPKANEISDYAPRILFVQIDPERCVFYCFFSVFYPTPLLYFYCSIFPALQTFKWVIKWPMWIWITSFVRDAIFYQVVCCIYYVYISCFICPTSVEIEVRF